MQLNLDLPKYKWKEILKYLTPHREESEYVAMLCTAIEMTKEGMTLNQKIYTFLVSNNLPPHCLPVVMPEELNFPLFHSRPNLT